MRKPKRNDDKYWTGTRNFNHIQYESDLEDYIIDLESESEQYILANVICRFNTSDKRMVKVVSGDDVFEGEVTKIEWDTDQWTYFVNSEWYCQSEVNGI